MLACDIIRKYNIKSYKNLNGILKRNNIKKRSRYDSLVLMNKNRRCGSIYTHNEKYFDEWSHNMAYILGFIAADGNVYKNILTIGLNDGDKEILKKISAELEYNGQLKLKKSKIGNKTYPAIYLSISSKKMCKRLNDLGIVERKSLIIDMPDSMPEEFYIDYIRGYFDGDGSIGIQKDKKCNRVQLRCRFDSGGRNLLLKFSAILSTYGVKHVPVNKKNKTNIYEIFYSTNDTMKLYDILYPKDEDYLYLRRKKKKFEECIKERIISCQ